MHSFKKCVCHISFKKTNNELAYIFKLAAGLLGFSYCKSLFSFYNMKIIDMVTFKPLLFIAFHTYTILKDSY